MKRISQCIILLFVVSFAFVSANATAQSIPSPEEFYGFKMGADGELVHWDKIVEYFNLLADRSDRIIVQNLGESTEGNPFILAIISSSDNLKNLEKYRQISKKLADPRGLSDREIEDLIKNGKFVGAVIVLHSRLRSRRHQWFVGTWPMKWSRATTPPTR